MWLLSRSKLLALSSLIIILLGLNASIIQAVECDGNLPEDDNLWDEYLNNCKTKITESQAQQETLSATISYLNDQINLTFAEIAKTEKELEILGIEIDDLTGKIASIDFSLEDLTKLFISRVQESYKQSKNNLALQTMVQADNFPGFIRGLEYIKRVRDHDRQVMIALEKSRLDYDNQRTAKEEKQAEVEVLQEKLEGQRYSLAQQKTSKNQLLQQTKNDEAKYQQLLSQALAEKSAIERALVSGVEVGPVKQGDPIALVGNSGSPGCSTGKHLHFEIRKGESWTDPGQYLQGKSVYDEDAGSDVSVGSGSWPWPVSDPIRLTQHYGQTPYSWRYKYSGGIHTGYDMVPKSTDVIRAPADGTLYESSQSCGDSSIINIVYIDHGDDVISLYLHVQ